MRLDGIDGNEPMPQGRKISKQFAATGYDECRAQIFSPGAGQRKLQRQARDRATAPEREENQVLLGSAARRV